MAAEPAPEEVGARAARVSSAWVDPLAHHQALAARLGGVALGWDGTACACACEKGIGHVHVHVHIGGSAKGGAPSERRRTRGDN